MAQYTSVSPAETGIMTGIISAGVGYTLAPRKYNLEQILTQKPDVFEKSFPKEVIQKSGKEQKKAFDIILDGRKILQHAAKTNSTDAKLAELLNAPKYSKAYRAVKDFLPKARVQTAIVFGVIGGLAGVFGRIIFGEKSDV